MKRLLAIWLLLCAALVLLGIGQPWPDTGTGSGSGWADKIEENTSRVEVVGGADGSITLHVDHAAGDEAIVIDRSGANELLVSASGGLGTATIDFDMILSANSIAWDASDTANVTLETLTNGGQVAFDIVDTDNTGIDATMRFWVDESDGAGDENLVEYLHLDGENDRVEAKELLAAEAGLEVTSGGTGIALTDESDECIYLSASDIICHTANGCTATQQAGTNFDFDTADFADGGGAPQDTDGTFVFPIPLNRSGSTVAARIFWTSNNAACNNGADDDVCWLVTAGGAIGSGTWYTDASSGSDAVPDRCHTQGDLHISPSTSGIATGWGTISMGWVKVTRDDDATHGDCADDDYGQDAELVGIQLCFQVDNVFNGE